MQKKEPKNKQRIQKMKDSGFRPWRLLLSIALFLIALIAIPGLGAKYIKNPINFFVFFFLAFQALAVVIDVAQGRLPCKIAVIFKVFLQYVLGTLLQILALLLCLPVIAVTFFWGPFMMLVFFVGSVGLVVYFIEGVLGIDIKGVVSFVKGVEVLITLAVVLVSGFLLSRLSWADKFFNLWIDKVTDLIVFLEGAAPPADKSS